MSEIVQLSESQKELAEKLLNHTRNGGVSSPRDFLEEWKAPPEDYKSVRGDNKEVKDIDATNIVGTGSKYNVDRFVSKRAERILEKLLAGEWQMEPTLGYPGVFEVDGEYYVVGDGNHRSIIHKYLGLPLRVEVYEPIFR